MKEEVKRLHEDLLSVRALQGKLRADLLLPLRRVYGASAITCCIKACSGGCVYSGSFFCVYWVISIGEVAGDRGAVQRACPVGPI